MELVGDRRAGRRPHRATPSARGSSAHQVRRSKSAKENHHPFSPR